jgi:hypothetical protein
MNVFFKTSPKELLVVRNKIFLTKGIPALNKSGFQKSPFSSSWLGRNNLRDFMYVLCRLNEHSQLEKIEVHITRGDSWIKIYLNIFELQPEIESLEQLNGVDGLQFHLPPNSFTDMQLRSDDVKGLYLFHSLFGKEHKLGSFYSKNGLKKRAEELGNLLESDLSNIDSFVKRWHELHEPLVINLNGKRL